MKPILKLSCSRCGHKWTTRYRKPPEVCSRCKSRLWNEEIPASEQFLRQVEQSLEGEELPVAMRRWMRAAFEFYQRAPDRARMAEEILQALANRHDS